MTDFYNKIQNDSSAAFYSLLISMKKLSFLSHNVFLTKEIPPRANPPALRLMIFHQTKNCTQEICGWKKFIRIVTVSKLLTVGFWIFGGFFFECFSPVLLLFLVDFPWLAFSGSVILLQLFGKDFPLGLL